MKKAISFLLVLSLVVGLSGVGLLAGCGGEAKEPTISTVSPASGKQGETLDVTITGTNLAEASSVSLGDGITCGSFTADSDTQITATVTIAASCAQGSKTLSVTTPDGSATKTAAFMVSSPMAPSVTAISPSSGEQAESLDVTITGSNFVNVSDVSLGDGVTVDSYNVDSDTQISASITIAPDALEAPRDVSVTNSAGPGIGSGIFTVTWPAALDAVIAAAQDEGVLSVWATGPMSAKLADAVEPVINEKYGIDINIDIAPGATPAHPQIAGILMQEYEAGKPASTDMLWISDAIIPVVYQGGIVSDAYNWQELFPYIPDENLALDGTVVEGVTTFYGIAYNTDEVSEADAPRKMEDVLGKGWALGTTPYVSGFCKMADLWGYEETKAYLQAMREDLAGFVGGADEARIASGEFTAIVLSTSDRIPRQLQEEGAPVGWIVPEDMPILSHEYFSILKHSAHPNVAALFVGFMMTSEGQQLLDEVEYQSDHRSEGTHTYELYQDMLAQGWEFLDSTADRIAPRLEQYQTWRAEFSAIVAGG